MATTIVLQASGLNKQPNQLALPDGSLTEASNVIIKRDNVVESRRGFKLDGDAVGSGSDTISQLFSYKGRILRQYDDALEYENGVNNDSTRKFSEFNGTFDQAEAGLRTKSIESNGNFYFTTNNGIQKISAKNADDLVTDADYISLAGGIKAIDLDTRLNITLGNQTGFLPADSAVAYKSVWAIKDKNQNLIQGSPSQRSEIYNPQLSLILQDFAQILGALDDCNQSTSLITDGNYVSTLLLGNSATASEAKTNVLSLATKLDTDILLANDSGTGAPLTISAAAGSSTDVVTITFTAGDPTDYLEVGSKIFLAGFGVGSSSSVDINGVQTITYLNATTIVFAKTGAVSAETFASGTICSYEYRNIVNTGSLDYTTSLTDITINSLTTNNQLATIHDTLDRIISQLQSEPTATIPSALATLFIDTLDITSTINIMVDVTIPNEVTADHFLQVYRSTISQATGTTVLTDLVPSDEMQLVYEAYPTAAELAAHTLTFEDITPDIFRGANLYTNEASGEGILQANDVPPFAKDINMFKNAIFYANTKTRHQKLLSLLGVSNMLTDYGLGTTPKFTIANVDSANTYSFVTGVAQISKITTRADTANDLNGTYFLVNSANNLEEYYVWYKTSGAAASDPAVAGKTGIRVEITTAETAANVATKTKNTISRFITDFTVAIETSTTLVITNTTAGYTDAITAGTSSFTSPTVTTTGRGELARQQVTSVTAVAGSLYVASGASDYFTLNTANNSKQYYVWFQSVSSTDPAVAGRTGIKVTVTGAMSATDVATAIKAALPAADFTTSGTGATFSITNVVFGSTTNATESVSDAGFTISTTTAGKLEVLLSSVVSPATAVEQTSKSLVRIVNKNSEENVYIYYLSGAGSVPGKMIVEARSLGTDEFYLLGNNSNTGAAFNPDVSPLLTISSITAGIPAANLITTSTAHGLLTGDLVVFNSTETVPLTDGVFTVTYVSPTTFRVDATITTGDASLPVGCAIRAVDAQYSENQTKVNRIYYSKPSQPEAVPILNYFDVGASNKEILRIFPLRDSLFIFKEDGLFRISGETSPFSLSLFDTSFILLAPDSLAVCNSLIYGWTNQGIGTISEAGANQAISRPIDVDILKLSTTQYTNFKTSTFGVGYESDNAYLVWTVTKTDDTEATICYRYSNVTNSWTTFDKTNTCGIVHPTENRLYLGAGDTNYMEVERKDFSRYDYADRETSIALTSTGYFGDYLKLSSVTDLEVGDVVVQEQTVSLFEYNQLLNKLDLDTGVTGVDYFSTLGAVAGDNLRTKLVSLAQKLDADTGVTDTDYFSKIDNKSGTITAISTANPTVITCASHGLITNRYIQISSSDSTPSVNGKYIVTVLTANTFSIDADVKIAGTTGSFVTQVSEFEDIKACYNKIADKLNNDATVGFINYAEATNTTIQESIITAVSDNEKRIDLNLTLDYMVGDLIIYKSIESTITYAPQTMGDSVGLKHLREATMMFENKAFTGATLSFATDLLPGFEDIAFNGDGNGIFGHGDMGFGFFGGASHSAPFRTYIPRNCQRCRYICAKFTHKIAREKYSIFGMTITGEISKSSRAYR